MDAVTLGGLVLLALVDGTSFGTLLIPLWMMLAPRVRAARLLLYLAVVCGFYFAVGLGLLAGLEVVTPVLTEVADSRAARVVQLVVGVALLLLSYVVDPAYDGIGRKRPAGERGPSPRAQRWQAQLTASDVSARNVVGIALAAAVLEVATMLPYLAAVGILTTSGEPIGVQVGLLGGYVVVMVLPALLALALRLGAQRLVEPTLERLGGWMTSRAGSAVAWVVGIVGVLMALDAASALWS